MPAAPPQQTNLDEATVEGFGDEWTRFDQRGVDAAELERLFNEYFALFPWADLPPNAVGADIGCGSGRWARMVAPRVGTLHCVDASPAALEVARRTLSGQPNVVFHNASVGSLPIEPASLDFCYSLGVLHHVPDTAAAVQACARLLKPGAPLLLYLYYALDNRPLWFRSLWRASDLARRAVSRLPHGPRAAVADAIAAGVYWPLARGAAAAEALGVDVDGFPLTYYRHLSFYVMRNDALDRFGTRLEQRFRREEVVDMMQRAGLRTIRTGGPPYWCAVGIRG